MNTKKSNKNSRRPGPRWALWLGVIASVLVLAGLVWLMVWILSGEESTLTPAPTLEPETVETPVRPPHQESTNDPAPSLDPSHSVVQYEGDDPNQLSELTGAISFWNVQNQTLTVAAYSDQAFEGTCILALLTADGETLRTTSNSLILDVTTSVCEKFELSLAGLSSGTYILEVTLQSEHKSGIVREEIQI